MILVKAISQPASNHRKKMKQRTLNETAWRYGFTLMLVVLCVCPARLWSAETNNLAVTFEELARTNRHFSRTVIIEKSALELRHSYLGEKDTARFRSWAVDQVYLLKHLIADSEQRDALIALLKHENPKVRTLALGALFQREDARDLRFIAALLEDRAPTFPDLSDDIGDSVKVSSSEAQELPQTVSDIARAMLMLWGVPHGGMTENKVLPLEKDGRILPVEKERFDRRAYQKVLESKDVSSRFKLNRRNHGRRIEPALALYQLDTKRVLADLQILPPYARAWTTYYLCHFSSDDYIDLAAFRTALISAFQAVGHTEGIRILQLKPEDKLPEIKPPFSESFKDDPLKAQFFRRMEEHAKIWVELEYTKNFFLQHSDELLLPEDVPLLLAEEKRASSFEAVYWVAAAAQLAHRYAPAESKRIINEALQRYPITDNSNGSNQAALQAVRWRTEGIKAAEELIEWFYTGTGSGSGQYYLLGYVKLEARPDTNELLAALVADKRFEQAKPNVIFQLLQIINRDLSVPLVSDKEIWRGMNNPDTVAEWRDLLRHYDFGKVQPPVTK